MARGEDEEQAGPVPLMWQKSEDDDGRNSSMRGATHTTSLPPPTQPVPSADPSVCSLQTPTGNSSEQKELKPGSHQTWEMVGSSLRARPFFSLALIKVAALDWCER